VVEPHRERVELRLPIFAVAVEPQRRLKDRPCIEPAPADTAGALLFDEAGPDQNLDVTRHRLQGDVERRGQLRNKQILAVETGQDRPADRIGERGKHTVERGRTGIVLQLSQVDRWGGCRCHCV